jgi:hypothetical protein
MANGTTAVVFTRIGVPLLAAMIPILGLMMLDRLHTIDDHVNGVAIQVNAKIDEVKKDQHDIALSIWNDLRELNKNFQDDKVDVHTELANEKARLNVLEASGNTRR